MAESHRGVWVAPWTGPRGELVLIAIDSGRRKIAECLVPFGVDSIGVSEAMFAQLELADPSGASGVRPRLARVARLRGLAELEVIA